MTSLARLLPAVRVIAPLATAIAVCQHGAVAALAAEPGPEPWLWAGVHLAAALAAAVAGGRLLDLAHPLRGLAGLAADNDAAALQAAAHRLAAAAVAGAAWGGADAASLLPSAAFWGAALVALALLAAVHRVVTRYADHEELAAGNTAAAIASAGLHLALAIVAAHAVLGDFAGWSQGFAGFAAALAWALLLWPLRQLVLARVIAGGGPRRLDLAIAGERDHGAAGAEALAYVTVALGIAAWA
jgi:uncharacterized membrane protein YjfL (UPF0719 family)